MEDREIVELFFVRSEEAIRESEAKYGKYCYTIAYNILCSNEDSEECVNDTYVNAWESIPPQRPQSLRCFLGCITRNLALNRYDYNTAKKRSEKITVVWEEYYESVPDGVSIENQFALKEAINRFLASLKKQTRIIFLRRYWYFCTVKEIADGMHLSESNVKVILHRTRSSFKEFLEKEGILV